VSVTKQKVTVTSKIITKHLNFITIATKKIKLYSFSSKLFNAPAPYIVDLFFADHIFILSEAAMDSNVNRNHKDSVFSALFSSPEVLRELYSAIEGIDVPPDAIVDINTLSDVLFMKQINDLSFTINNRIVVLIEHQSTINENVPLRLLMYIARVYEKIIDREKLYQKRLEKIPSPEFIVLYNGRDKCPDHKELRLSDAFKDITGLKLQANTTLPLELVVQVYNINHGRNPEMLKKCETLESYSFFMGKIKEFNTYLSLEESIKNAVKYCIERNILREFLEKHGSEVINMLTDELTIEEIVEVRAREAEEEGWDRGHEKGLEKGLKEGREEERNYFLSLLDQGFSTEEIKIRLTETKTS